MTGSAAFDGSGNISITTVVADSSHNHAASNITSGTITAARLPTATTSALGIVKIGTGIAVSNGTISNSGVRSIATGSANGTISVNTNGTSADVAVKGLGTLAYSSATYAGGTAITLNGASKAGATASFFAPTTVGTAGQFLKSNGSGAPVWANVSVNGIASITQTSSSNASGGSNVWTATMTDGTTATFTVKNGTQGPKGDKGDTGAIGPQGPKGDTGPAGATF